MAPPFFLRNAHADESRLLTELCLRSKAMWGYNEVYMEGCKRLFHITKHAISKSEVLIVIPVGKTEPIAVSAFRPRGCGTVVLEYFFVEPSWTRCGVGQFLYHNTLRVIWAQKDNVRLEFDADYHAHVFYEKMGARCIGHTYSGMNNHPPLPRFEQHVQFC